MHILWNPPLNLLSLCVFIVVEDSQDLFVIKCMSYMLNECMSYMLNECLSYMLN